MQWFEIAGESGSKIPGWGRSAALADDGTIYLPAALGAAERRVALMAMWDGVGVVEMDGHHFVPSSWLAREFPDIAGLCQEVEEKVRAMGLARGVEGG